MNNCPKIKFLCFVFICLTLITTPLLSTQKNESHVKISWEEFRKILKLGTDEISLTWEEFQQLIAQTGEDIRLPYTVNVKNGKVILPRNQFIQILDKMKPPRERILTPPVNYIITKAEYQGDMGQKSTTITATFTLEIFEKNEQCYRQIPFLPQSVGLEEVLLDDKRALVTVINGWYHINTSESGHHKIRVKYYVSSNLDKGPQILKFPIVRTAITTFALTVPLEKVDLSISNAKEVITSQKGGSTHIRAILPATDCVEVSAHRKYMTPKGIAKDIPAKIYAETINLLSIEEDAVRITSRIKLNILQNTITNINAKVPENYTILDIRKKNGSRMQEWHVNKTGKGSIVNIPFETPVEGNIAFDIITERLFKSEKTDIHFNGFKIQDAIRETGYLGAEKRSTAQASPTSTEKLDRIDIKDLPYELINMSKRPLLFGFRYLRHPYNLGMTIIKHEELPTISSIIDMASIITIILEDGKILTKVNYTIRNTWKQFLKLDIPPDSEIWTVYVDSIRENASRSSDGKIMIPLARSRFKGELLKSFPVELIYYSKGDSLGSFGSKKIQFPTADIMITKMLWSVYLPEENHYLHFSGNVEKEEMAGTLNLMLGKSRNFSIDQVESYNEVASNLERSPQKQQTMTRYGESLQSHFSNKSINQRDIARQMRLEANLNTDFQTEQKKRLGKPGSGSNIFKIELPTSGQIYRFNKTVIEGESIELKFYYASPGVMALAKVIAALILISILFLIRKRIFAFSRKIFSKSKNKKE